MKCPNCGEEMPKGSLYCEHCGEDIHIVPDFEPEIERNIAQDINNIIDEIQAENRAAQEKDSEEAVTKSHAGLRRWCLALTAGVGLLVIAAAAWKIYGYNSEEYQADRGAYYVEQGKYDKALACYSRALELDSGNVELMFRLAEVYLLRNNKIEYEYLLREIARSSSASTEELESAYSKLIAIYSARGDYQTIHDMLIASNNETIMSSYQNYIARAPEFSVKEGYYTSIQPLKLTGFGTGKIYYTMDGSAPTQESTLYTAPIILENGDYLVSAYFVTEKGIASDIVTKEYHIENDVIPEPDISVTSGEYHFPINIEVSGEEGEIYYTVDGSDPTYSSIAYTGPIPMPLGRSTFKFVQIVDGVTGLVAVRNYRLEMNTDFTPAQAVEVIVNYSLNSGKIYDKEGYYDDSDAVYRYEYQYVTNINNVSDFYVIAECLRSADGSLAKTGSNYAVNAYTGEYFRLEQGQNGDFSLAAIEKIDTENSEDEE